MKLQDYFKKILTDLFLNTKHIAIKKYQNILDEYCNGGAKCIVDECSDEKIIIAFEFEDITLKYVMTIAEGKKFTKVISIDYIEKE